jgi:di/tricarboxylate transporter
LSDLAITLLILVAAVVLFVWNRIPVGIVALGVASSLWATGVLTLDQVFAGFGTPTMVLIAALFVVAEALDAAGITTWAGQQIVSHAGESRTRLIVFTMAVGALVTALITPNGSAAALIPMVVVLSLRGGMSPSRLLMPLAFSAHAGSMLMLTGTAINVLVSEAAINVGESGFRFFEFARVGIPLVIGTILIVVLFGERLLPERTAKTLPRDLSQLPATLQRQYLREDELARLHINSGSSLAGTLADAIDLTPYESVHIIAALDDRGRPLVDRALEPGHVLVVRGQRERFERFAADHGLTVRPEAGAPGTGLISSRDGVAEVIVTPRSPYIGETVFPGMVTDSGQLVVLAVQRHGEDLGSGEVRLMAGDSMLLQGHWSALDEHTRDPNVMLVDSPDAIRRQTVSLGPRATPALAVLAVMIVLMTTGVVPAVIAGLLAAIAMILLGVVTVEQAHRSLNWTTLILVGAMIPLSTAITETGAAQLFADVIIGAVGGGSPYLLLLGIFVITAILGQLISNTATALIIIPIALSIASDMGISPLTVLMSVNVASAAALLTPVATPANMMVMGPGGYQFGDYWKLGIVVMLLYLLVAVFVVPFWWPFAG